MPSPALWGAAIASPALWEVKRGNAHEWLAIYGRDHEEHQELRERGDRCDGCCVGGEPGADGGEPGAGGGGRGEAGGEPGVDRDRAAGDFAVGAEGDAAGDCDGALCGRV